MAVKIPEKIGHRGAAGHAPENTLASIRKAANLGARWVEFDVMLSHDGIPILMHDNTLNRTTNGKGPISAQSLNDLRTLDAGSWFDKSFADEPIPTLAETLLLAEALGLGCNVEIKPAPETSEETAKAVIEVVNSSQIPFSIIMSSFRKPLLERYTNIYLIRHEGFSLTRFLKIGILSCKNGIVSRSTVTTNTSLKNKPIP